MRADVIVLFEPPVDDGLGLFDRWEPFPIEHLAPKRSVEAFVVSILPWTTGINLDWLNADLVQPGTQIAGDELRSIVGAQIH